MRIGLVQVYTGDGKGKTTAALGLALRAVGHGWRVAVFQFLKGGGGTGEIAATSRLAPQLTITQCGTGLLIVNRPPTPQEIGLAREGLSAAEDALTSSLADLVVLDEVAAAVNLGLLSVEAVAGAITRRAEGVEVVLTGRDMPPALVALADMVSEIRAVKHPFGRGIGAREGIEY